MERETVIRLAKLSAISLTEEETDVFLEDMQKIMDFASEIENNYEEKNLSFIENENALRIDVAKSSYERTDILKNAPTSYDGFFKLPRRNV